MKNQTYHTRQNKTGQDNVILNKPLWTPWYKECQNISKLPLKNRRNRGKIDTLMHKYMATDFPGFVPGAAKLIPWPLTFLALYLARLN
jgi:hypothetical protein